jgi:hypothetical protein
VRIQRMHQRRPFLNDPNPRVAVAVNPSLVTLGHAEPPLQIEIVPDRLDLPLAHEQPGEEANHHPRHLLTDRIRAALELVNQLLEFLLAVGAATPAGLRVAATASMSLT